MADNYLPNLAFQPYIAPQQQLPVEEFNNLGAVLNQRYDKNIAEWDALDAFINQVQLSDADQGIKTSVVQDTRNILKDIREKGNWENGRLQVREVAKRLANDQSLTIGQQNFKRMQEQMAKEADMRTQGINLIDFNQGRFAQSTIDPTTGRARVLDFSGSERLQDYDARRKSLFEGLQADGFDRESSSPVMNAATGMVYQVGSGASARYVSAKKVKEVAQRNLNNYLESQEGQQEYKMLTTSNSMNPNPLTPQEARKQILDGIVNTGLTRTFSQTGSKSSTSIVSMGGAGGSGSGASLPEGQRAEALPIEQSKLNPLYKDLTDKLTLKRRYENVKSSAEGHSALGAVTGAPGAQGVPTLGSKERYATLSKKEMKAVENVGATLGIKKQPSGQYAVKDIDRIRDYITQRVETATAPTYRAFTEEEISKNNNYIANGNLRSRGFYDLEKGKFTEFKDLPSEVKEALNGKKAGEIQFSGVVSPDNHFYDLAKDSKREVNSDGWLRPEYVTIAGKSYAVTSPTSEIRKTDIGLIRAINQITSANRYGVPVRIKGPDGQRFVTAPNGKYSPDGQPIYEIKDMNGNKVSELPLNNMAGTLLQGAQIEE